MQFTQAACIFSHEGIDLYLEEFGASCAAMAEATTSSQNPAKKARVTKDDEDRLKKAEADYEEARQQLDDAYKARPRDSDFIDYLKEKMRDAQKRIELLLQRQSQPLEALQFSKLVLAFLDFPIPLIPLLSPLK